MRIIIQDYTPIWKELFRREKENIYKVIDFTNPYIEHIGSTSIDGMAAKPIIDIMIGLPKNEQINEIIEPIVLCGYTYIRKFEQYVPKRKFFIYFENIKLKLIDYDDEFPSDNQSRKFHIHVIEHNCSDWIRHLAFRDYLRCNDVEMKAYKEFKEKLSKTDFKGTTDYSAAKNLFLKELEIRAFAWYTNRISNS